MRRLTHRRGFVLITTAACLIVFFAVIGLAVDAGRLYVAHEELQTFVDEAAVAASFELDGTSAGIARAQAVAAAGPGSGTSVNHWYFGTQTVAGATVQFATAPDGPFVSNPFSAAGYRFVQVQVTTPVNVYFLPVLRTPGVTQNITVSAVAGQSRTGWLGDGLEPFSPIAHATTDPNFGFTIGQQYTLRWPPPGKQNKESCPGDEGFDPPDSNWRGYINVGQGNGNSGLRDAIVNNAFSLETPLEVGSLIDEVNGEKSVSGAVDERFGQDTDTSSPTFAGYHGNGRRLIFVAVNDGRSPARVVGFGLFFLDTDPCGDKNTSPCCAEYVGAAVVGSIHKGAGNPPGIYRVRLVK